MKDLENGPYTEANRECRDTLFCLLFVAGCCAMVYLGIYGFTNGDVHLIFRGVDEAGNICGDTNTPTTALFPYLYWTQPDTSLQNRACVDACPTWDGSAVVQVTCAVASQCNTNSYQVTFNDQGGVASGTYTAGSGQIIGYDSYSVLSRACVPNPNMFTSVFSSISSSFSSALDQGALADFINDVKNNWYWLLAATGVSFIVAFIIMFFLRCCAGCIVWISLFGIMFLLVGTGLIFLFNAGYLQSASSVATYLGVPSVNSQYNEPIGWTLIGLGCFFFIIILCCCNRIRLAVAICKSAGQFVGSVCTVILVPIFQTVLAFSLWVGALISMVYLVSAAKFVVMNSTDYFTSIESYGDTALVRFYIFVFLTLWVNAFLSAMTIFIIASATCMWYYSHAPGNELSLPIWRSYKMVFRYHWGSLAIGALLLAIVQFMQMIVELFKRQAEAQNNKCLEYVLKCVQCFLACVECIVKFINTQAYIQIALKGRNFCYAAKDGFELVWSNPLRYAIVGGIGTVIMFLGKLMIACLTAFLFYLFVTYVTSVHNNYAAPIWSVVVFLPLFSSFSSSPT